MLTLKRQQANGDEICIVLYTVSQKTSHLWLAITLTHVHRFWYFWQKCYR